jgi:hypothetical protein
MKLLRPYLDAQILRLVQVPEIPTDGGSSGTTIVVSTNWASICAKNSGRHEIGIGYTVPFDCAFRKFGT